jgi:hypothetical protein
MYICYLQNESLLIEGTPKNFSLKFNTAKEAKKNQWFGGKALLEEPCRLLIQIPTKCNVA